MPKDRPWRQQVAGFEEIRVVPGLRDMGIGILISAGFSDRETSVSGESGGISADPLFPLGISVVGGRRLHALRGISFFAHDI
jgi:hypothetical protein